MLPLVFNLSTKLCSIQPMCTLCGAIVVKSSKDESETILIHREIINAFLKDGGEQIILVIDDNMRQQLLAQYLRSKSSTNASIIIVEANQMNNQIEMMSRLLSTHFELVRDGCYYVNAHSIPPKSFAEFENFYSQIEKKFDWLFVLSAIQRPKSLRDNMVEYIIYDKKSHELLGYIPFDSCGEEEFDPKKHIKDINIYSVRFANLEVKDDHAVLGLPMIVTKHFFDNLYKLNDCRTFTDVVIDATGVDFSLNPIAIRVIPSTNTQDDSICIGGGRAYYSYLATLSDDKECAVDGQMKSFVKTDQHSVISSTVCTDSYFGTRTTDIFSDDAISKINCSLILGNVKLQRFSSITRCFIGTSAVINITGSLDQCVIGPNVVLSDDQWYGDLKDVLIIDRGDYFEEMKASMFSSFEVVNKLKNIVILKPPFSYIFRNCPRVSASNLKTATSKYCNLDSLLDLYESSDAADVIDKDEAIDALFEQAVSELVDTNDESSSTLDFVNCRLGFMRDQSDLITKVVKYVFSKSSNLSPAVLKETISEKHIDTLLVKLVADDADIRVVYSRCLEFSGRDISVFVSVISEFDEACDNAVNLPVFMQEHALNDDKLLKKYLAWLEESDSEE